MKLFLIFVVITFAIMFLWYFMKALKDPDVHKASELGMSITRFHKYQRLFDEYQEFMSKHGVDSPESNKKFKEIWKQIDNTSEWKRYSDYRAKESSIENSLNKYLQNK